MPLHFPPFFLVQKLILVERQRSTGAFGGAGRNKPYLQHGEMVPFRFFPLHPQVRTIFEGGDFSFYSLFAFQLNPGFQSSRQLPKPQSDPFL